MKFWISVPQNVVTIGATSAGVDCSSLGTEIRNIYYNGSVGFVTFTDDTGNSNSLVPTHFTDPSPYQGIINAWCASQPDLTLGQAQSVKGDFVETLYLAKRQAPIQVTVGAGALNWDASDESVSAMQQQLVTGAISLLQTLATDLGGDFSSIGTQEASHIVTPFNSLVTDLNSAFATIAGDINSVETAISTLITSINSAFSVIAGDINSVEGAITTLIGEINTAVTALNGAVNSNVVDFLNNSVIGVTSPATGTINQQFNNFASSGSLIGSVPNLTDLTAPSAIPGSGLGTVTGPTISGTGLGTITGPTFSESESYNPTITAFSGLISPIAWIPFGSTSTVNVTNVEMSSIVSAILARRQTLQAGRLSREAAIAALSTISSVIAYDATAGW